MTEERADIDSLLVGDFIYLCEVGMRVWFYLFHKLFYYAEASEMFVWASRAATISGSAIARA